MILRIKCILFMSLKCGMYPFSILIDMSLLISAIKEIAICMSASLFLKEKSKTGEIPYPIIKLKTLITVQIYVNYYYFNQWDKLFANIKLILSNYFNFKSLIGGLVELSPLISSWQYCNNGLTCGRYLNDILLYHRYNSTFLLPS